jgi:ATP-binding cassette subfamily B protein
MLPPALIGYTVNHLIADKVNIKGLSIPTTFISGILHGTGYSLVLTVCGWLLVIYLLNLGAVYLRTILMGGFGQHLLFTLRNAIFNKLQELPVAFFSQNKAGDLISRINNDTDKVNQFFSQSLMQFVSSIFIIVGAGIALVCLNWRLGLATLAPGALMWLFTKLLSPWVKKKNAVSAKATGALSAEIQESLSNFKVVLAFNRRDYFRQRFEVANSSNYSTSINAGIANNVFMPVYGFLSSMGQLVVLLYGIYLITIGYFTPGFLIAYFMYTTSFYDPLRQLAALWAGFQVAIASWDRISHLLTLESDLVTVPATSGSSHAAVSVVPGNGNGHSNGTPALIEFRDVSFRIPMAKTFCVTIASGWKRARPMRWSGPRAAAKPLRLPCWPASTIRPKERCCSMAGISGRSPPANGRRRSALSCRTRSCSPARCTTISCMATSNIKIAPMRN